MTGDYYSINGTSVLNATTLGSGITSSSLTSVGTLSSLYVSGISRLGSYGYVGQESSGTDIIIGYNAINSELGVLARVSDAGGTSPQAIIIGATEGIRFITKANNNDVTFNTADYEAMRIEPDGDVQLYKGNLCIKDSKYIYTGTGNDLQIYHDTTNSYISNTTGDLIIQTDGTGAGIILDIEDDTLEIKYSGTLGATFSTTGLNLVSGDYYSINGTSVLNATTLGSGVLASSLTSVGTLTSLATGDISMADSKYLKIGTGEDLQLYHDASNSYISNLTGDLIIQTDGSGTGIILDTEDDTLEIKYSGTLGATFSTTGLNLASGDYYSINGTSVLNATTLGSGVTGSSLTSVGTLTSLSTGDISMVDSKYIKLGTGNDLQLYHNGTHSYITNATGDLVVKLADASGSNCLSIVDSGNAEQAFIDSDGRAIFTSYSNWYSNNSIS